MKNTLLLLIIFSNYVLPQIDTSIWYPLEIGNYWEYKTEDGSWTETYKVVKDTLMSNGKSYAKIQYDNSGYYFQRVENNSFVYFYDRWSNSEYKFYDFVIAENQYWDFGRQGHLRFLDYNSELYSEIFGENIKVKKFTEHKFVPDTIGFTYETIAKGVGPIVYGWYNSPDETDSTTLVGAIINGQKYGYITNLEEEHAIITDYSLDQNYPNPFNPSTTIIYQLPEQTKVTLKICDLLGRELEIIVDEEQSAGSYSVIYEANNLSSGVYFYQLITNDIILSKKFVLVK